jgi:methylenetetrahydrofolate reductase (NADPH)
VLHDLEASGIDNIIALRGDPPKGQSAFEPNPDGFRYAFELVRFIRSKFKFAIGVAGYPEKHIEARSMEDDLVHLKEKVQAGGDFIITQLFFDNQDFFRFQLKLKGMGITKPLIAGIMPITDYAQIKRFTGMCGASIPEALRDKLEAADGDKEKVARIGVEHAVSQCHALLRAGAAGLHFYTLNRSQSTREIFDQLKADGLVLK